MMGWMPEPAALSANSKAPKRLPLSAIATAGMTSALHRFTNAFTVIAPSESE
jgi:hypothetical protein